jgi:hypothetical protein
LDQLFRFNNLAKTKLFFDVFERKLSAKPAKEKLLRLLVGSAVEAFGAGASGGVDGE